VGVAGEEGGGDRDLLDQGHRRERGTERLDPREAGGDLGEHDGVQDQGATLRGAGEVLLRPVAPLGVLGEDIEQDTAVDQRSAELADVPHPRVRASISSVVSSPVVARLAENVAFAELVQHVCPADRGALGQLLRSLVVRSESVPRRPVGASCSPRSRSGQGVGATEIGG